MSYTDIVFSTSRDYPEDLVFIEVENSFGESIRVGEWVDHGDGYRVLRIQDPEITSETSDGYHTFDELYYYRMVYNAQAAQAWLADGIPVVKSWNHHDGLLCFGGGMFVIQAELPTGQVSNHYKAEHWDLFKVPAVGLPPVYDGHTPAIAADRMAEYIRTRIGNTIQ